MYGSCKITKIESVYLNFNNPFYETDKNYLLDFH